MKNSALFKKIFPLVLLTSSIFISCQKEHLQEDQTNQEQSKSGIVRTYSIRNEKQPYYFKDKNGVEHFSKPLRTDTDYPGCDDDYADNEERVYVGSYVDYDWCGTADVTVYMSWDFVMPASTVPSIGSATRFRYRFSTSDPYTYSTSCSLGLVSSYTNPSTGQPVKKWRFSGSFVIPRVEYCMKNAYYGSMYKLETDCSDNDEITHPAVVDYLTPSTYMVWPMYAMSNSPGSSSFTVLILTSLCSNCHFPSLGNCSEYIFRYKKVGTGTWSYLGVNQALSTPTITATVGSTGTYEYEYTGRLTTGSPGTWTPYVYGGTVVVN